MWEMKMYFLKSRSRGISYMKYVNGRRTGLVTFCVETFCVSDIYLMMADLDSRNMFPCITKDECTTCVRFVWSNNWLLIKKYSKGWCHSRLFNESQYSLCWLSLSTYAASKTLLIKIHHIHTILQRNVYILTIRLFYTALGVYMSHWFVSCCVTLVWFPDEGSLRTEICKNVECDVVL